MSGKSTITLRSENGVEFLVSQAVARQSKLLRLIVDNKLLMAYFRNSITLHTITTPILTKVIDYCTKHETTEEGSSSTPDSSKISVDPATLTALTEAADYLEIEWLQGVLSSKKS